MAEIKYQLGDMVSDPRADIWPELKVEFDSLESAAKAGFLFWHSISDKGRVIYNNKEFIKRKMGKIIGHMVYKWYNNECIYVIALA